MICHDEMDLTAYLQTEGRRLAGLRGPRAAPAAPRDAQQQAGLPDQETPRSLSEALQRMHSERTPVR